MGKVPLSQRLLATISIWGALLEYAKSKLTPLPGVKNCQRMQICRFVDADPSTFKKIVKFWARLLLAILVI